MPTRILEGPRSDPNLRAPTDPFTPPPLTKVRPRPQQLTPRPVARPVPRRRRGRLVVILTVLAIAGAATGGTLAWLEVTGANGPSLPTARAALSAVRGSGDFTTLPFTDTVSMDFEVAIEPSEDGGGGGFICRVLGFCENDEPEFETHTVTATASIATAVPMTAVRRSDITVQHRSVFVQVPSAVLGEPYVDPASINVQGVEVDQQDVIDEAASIIEDEARAAGVLRDAQRDVRRSLVHRLHGLGFRHVRVDFV